MGTTQVEYDAALQQARTGFDEGGIPIGAALWRDGQLLGVGRNRRMQQGSAILHGEIDCLNTVGRLTDYRGTTLYTTLSPCSMCAGAIALFQIPEVIVGEAPTFPGEIEFLRERGVRVEVIDDPVATDLLARFAANNPEAWSEDIGGR